ncbi:hypothetical protein [Flagellimonas marina]|uniref:Uncharacterized protein n=1 Tax=Flagellimonas marina TaxID=1775168 RepID=A0ABV8PQG4_9FLAO
MKSRNCHHALLGFCLTVLSWGCERAQIKDEIVLTETEGIARPLEYVVIKSSDRHQKTLVLKDKDTDEMIRGIKLAQEDSNQDSTSYIFPVSISAHQKRTFLVLNSYSEQNQEEDTLKITGEHPAITVENGFFIADFNTNPQKIERGLYPGQLSGIFIKKRDILLKRELNNMHWAPNFQKESEDYKTIGHANVDDAKVSQNNAFFFEMVKKGKVKGYEEIDLSEKYEFYAGLPYFLYESTMSFNKDANLFFLRNNEMTMDKLFTHLVYSDSLGKTKEMLLYDDVKIDSLTKAPLTDDVKWVGFINKPKGYGLVSLQLDYENTHINGGEPPLYKPHMKITKAGEEGRYWNRRLVHDHNTIITKGSRYHEKNAYLVLDSLDNLNKQINYFFKTINNPISIYYSGE